MNENLTPKRYKVHSEESVLNILSPVLYNVYALMKVSNNKQNYSIYNIISSKINPVQVRFI